MPHTPRNIQAPYDETDFWDQWGSTTPRMSTCLKLTPTEQFGGDAAAIGLTSNTLNMELPGHVGITFKATPGLAPSVVESALDEPPNLDMAGIYQAGIFTHEEVLAGKWNFAEFEVFSVCWDNVDLGEFLHARGNLGIIKDYQQYFKAEGRGLLSRLSNDVNACTARFCRVKRFRDAECGHTAATVTIGADVIDIEQDSTVVIQAGELQIQVSTLGLDPDYVIGFFANGEIEATSGTNTGVTREIADSGPVIGRGYIDVFVKRPFPFVFSGGETVHLVAGCNRTLEDCMKYENVTNRRAEDYIPGIESISRLPNN